MSYMDTSEDILVRDTPSFLNILLKDQTTKKNIVWATHSYEWFGKGFWESDRITSKKITGPYAKLIQPRVDKSTYDQKDRTNLHQLYFWSFI